jgi:hypothetical protein
VERKRKGRERVKELRDKKKKKNVGEAGQGEDVRGRARTNKTMSESMPKDDDTHDSSCYEGRHHRVAVKSMHDNKVSLSVSVCQCLRGCKTPERERS